MRASPGLIGVSKPKSWVTTSLGASAKGIFRDEIIYAEYVDEWGRRCHLEHWNVWSSFLLSSGRPSIHTNVYKDILELRAYMATRIWPHQDEELENAFLNFTHVLNDFISAFDRHCESDHGQEYLYTETFYRIKQWNPQLYDKLLAEYNFHVDLVQDLMLELTHAANFVCDRVRAELLPNFQRKEGRLSITTGPGSDFLFTTRVVEYDKRQRQQSPYPGLTSFVVDRKRRDMHFGSGTRPSAN